MTLRQKQFVLLGLGSNIERHAYITLALDALEDAFGPLTISTVFESEPVGFKGHHNFYNLVVGFESERGVGDISRWTKALERSTGRKPEDPKYGPRRLDIDILTVGDQVGIIDGVELPRGEILTNAFVLRPLAETFPERRHPIKKQHYRSLWAAYQNKDQRLWPVEFLWRGKAL